MCWDSPSKPSGEKCTIMARKKVSATLPVLVLLGVQKKSGAGAAGPAPEPFLSQGKASQEQGSDAVPCPHLPPWALGFLKRNN